jgi:Dyp-type peroxidase family
VAAPVLTPGDTDMSTLEPLAASVEVDDLQGLVVRSYARLEHAVYVPAAFDASSPGEARAWLAALAGRVTPASRRSAAVEAEGQAINLALTSAGLAALGLPRDALAGFSREFLEGMATDHRRRVLGDTDEADPGRWAWGGPGNPALHAMLFLFADGAERLRALLAAERAHAEARGIALREPLGSIMLPGDREHFGFHDGIAQPRIGGLPGSDAARASRETPLPPGEVVLGYPNAYGKLPDSPTVADAGEARECLPLAPADPDQPHAPPRRDLGRNGSYVVFRQLAQDVRAFWRFTDERTGSDPARRTWLASKIVGRWPNGAPLVLHPEREPETVDLERANDFMYAEDRHGDRCPIGAHIRRTNPRDGMRPGPKESLLVADRHRLLRRGRAYGRPLDDSFDPSRILQAPDTDGEERGLHFVCFNTDIARQFEFVQHTWVNSMKFDGLYADPDALIAPHVDPARARAPEQVSCFTVQQQPVRHRETGIPRFVTMRGGAYLFMPGLRALRYLASLG